MIDLVELRGRHSNTRAILGTSRPMGRRNNNPPRNLKTRHLRIWRNTSLLLSSRLHNRWATLPSLPLSGRGGSPMLPLQTPAHRSAAAENYAALAGSFGTVRITPFSAKCLWTVSRYSVFCFVVMKRVTGRSSGSCIKASFCSYGSGFSISS